MEFRILTLLFSAFLNALLWVLAITLFPQDSPAAILHYSAVVGVDFIGSSHQIYILPLIGLVIFGGNVLLGYMLRATSSRAAWLLWSTSAVAQVILIISFLMLWLLNR